MSIFNMLMEAVVLAFMLGGIVGASVALHLRRIELMERRAIARGREAPALEPVRVRRRPPR